MGKSVKKKKYIKIQKKKIKIKKINLRLFKQKLELKNILIKKIRKSINLDKIRFFMKNIANSYNMKLSKYILRTRKFKIKYVLNYSSLLKLKKKKPRTPSKRHYEFISRHKILKLNNFLKSKVKKKKKK